MTPVRFFGWCGVVLALGCSKEKTFVEPSPPLAAIHFLNAVPDTGQMDFRVVDIVSNAGFFDANFRDGNSYYVPIEAGTRQIRVFMSSTSPAISSQVIADTAITLTASAHYTFLHTGFSRTGQAPARAVLLIADNPPGPAVGQIGLRLINAAAGLGGGSLDIRITRHATDTLPDAPVTGNLAYGASGSYVAMGRDSVATDSIRISVTAAGTKTPVLFSVKLPAGVAGTATVNPIAGTRVAGSVMTAVIVPRSVAGSQAPQGAAFTVPSAVVLVDLRPPNTAP